MSRADSYRAELENLEIDLLVEAIWQLRGIRLRESSGAPVRRRVWEAIRKEKARTVSGLQEKLLHDPAALDRFLKAALPPFVPCGAGFLQAFRLDIVPLLRTYPFARLWQIGCNSVFETYSLAIILREEGLGEKATLYATDVNDGFLENCASGAFPLADLEKYEKVYKKSGGRATLSHYFSGGGRSGVFDAALRRQMVFARHSLATDGSPNEFNAVFCRNPLRHFDRETEERAHVLVHQSLVMFGLLGLAKGETPAHARTAERFEEFDPEHNLYRKIG